MEEKELRRLWNNLYSIINEERHKSGLSKNEAFEFQLTEDEKLNIIGIIESDTGEEDYIYSLYPWKHRLYAITEHGFDIPFKPCIQGPTLEKLYNSIIERLKK